MVTAQTEEIVRLAQEKAEELEEHTERTSLEVEALRSELMAKNEHIHMVEEALDHATGIAERFDLARNGLIAGHKKEMENLLMEQDMLEETFDSEIKGLQQELAHAHGVREAEVSRFFLPPHPRVLIFPSETQVDRLRRTQEISINEVSSFVWVFVAEGCLSYDCGCDSPLGLRSTIRSRGTGPPN